MDPITAVNLAASIVQFIDFANKLLTGIQETKQSSTGKRAEYEELDLTVDASAKLHEHIVCLTDASDNVAKLSRREKELLPLQRVCVKIGNELKAALQTASVERSIGSKPRGWESVKAGLASVLKERKIRDLEGRLARLQRQIDSHLIAQIQKQQAEVLDLLQSHTLLSVPTELRSAKELRTLLKAIQATFSRAQASTEWIENLQELKGDSTKMFRRAGLEIPKCRTAKELGSLLDWVKQMHRDYISFATSQGRISEIIRAEEIWRDTTQLGEVVNQEGNSNFVTARKLLVECVVFYAEEFGKRRADIGLANSVDLINLGHMVERAKILSAERSILTSLDYDARTSRLDKIKQAHTKTFQWIFDHKSANRGDITFAKWLRDSTGVYWISGKPGCGKSTLMKYLCDHSKTLDILNKWAAPASLVVASFFFWNSGTAMQRSLEGLLRSIIVQILDQCPELIPAVFPARWELAQRQTSVSGNVGQTYWSYQELLDGFRRITRDASLSSKFCFFIDGLDEYEGSDREMVEFIGEFDASPFLKFCVASRPHADFTKAYGKFRDRSLNVAELTEDDIRLYVKTTLNENPGFQSLMKVEPVRCQRLADGVVQHANGVFLWVYLVVSRLLEGIEVNEDRISDLERKLDQIPRELDQLFRHIIDSVDSSYHESQAMMFQVACHAEEPLDLIAYHYMDEEDPDSALKAHVVPMTPSELEHKERIMQVRINVRCKGLLEVAESPSSPSCRKRRVQFLHRTFRDFLRAKEMQDFLSSRTAPNLQPLKLICLALLAELKSFRYLAMDSNRHCQYYAFLDNIAHYALEMDLAQDGTPEDILEEVMKILPLLPRPKLPLPLPDSSWALYFKLTDDPENFIRFMAERGLASFVRSHFATSAGQKPCAPTQERLDNLLVAVIKPMFSSSSERVLNPSIVKFLLDLGANPDACWEPFLEWSSTLVKGSDRAKAAFYVTQMLLEHGATRPGTNTGDINSGKVMKLAESKFEVEDATVVRNLVPFEPDDRRRGWGSALMRRLWRMKGRV